MIKVSIIIPVYNASKYISKCLDSLIKQTYKHLEIIVIDDGSTDESEIVITEYLKKCGIIKYFKQKKSGANIARKNGIKKSTGDYIMFVDADDYITTSTAIEELVAAAKTSKADIIKFQFSNYTRGNLPEAPFTNIVELRKILLTSAKLNNITTEMISRRIVRLSDDVFNIASSYAEDLMMNLSFFDRAKTVRILNNPYYYYTYNHSSSTKTNDVNRLVQYTNEIAQLPAFLLSYAKKWELYEQPIINKIYFRAIQGICKKLERILESNSDYTICHQIRVNLNESLPAQVNGKVLIKRYEKNPINKIIYLNIYDEHFKTAKTLILFKTLFKKIIKHR